MYLIKLITIKKIPMKSRNLIPTFIIIIYLGLNFIKIEKIFDL